MSEDICGASIYRYGQPLVCDLKPGHEPPHVDTYEGGGEW
jgi:hypothetical protein